MSKNIHTPLNQQRTTNIVVVRLKKLGLRFEIACYPNKVNFLKLNSTKVMQFRQNIETDLAEVLQTEYVFYMVSKGTFAKKEDLKAAFGDKTEKEICEIILRKGELQISPKERQLVYDNLYKDISTIVANKCVNPDTKTPYTATQIEREMKDLNFVLKPNKSAKSQALELIKKLKERINIVRASMRISVLIKKSQKSLLKRFIEEHHILVEKEENPNDYWLYVLLIDPGLFRDLDKLVSSMEGKIDVEDSCVTNLGDIDIDNVDVKEDQEEEEQEEIPEKKEILEEDPKKAKKKKDKKEKHVEVKPEPQEEELSDDEDTKRGRRRKKKVQIEQVEEEIEDFSSKKKKKGKK
jgi:ribosome maturation protein SDO1